MPGDSLLVSAPKVMNGVLERSCEWLIGPDRGASTLLPNR